MQILRPRLIVAAFGMALTLPAFPPAGLAQEAPAPAETPSAGTPSAETPSGEAPAPAAPSGEAAPAGASPAAPGGAAGAAAAPGTPNPAANPAAVGNPAQQEVVEIVKSTFDDWQVRCAPNGTDCFLYQLALDQEKNPVAEVSIVKLPDSSEAAAGVTVVSPLGTLLTTGVTLQIDGGEKRQYPFAWCSQVGCFARFGLPQQAIDALKRGKAGTLTLVSINRPETPVVLAMSLKGFTAGFDALETPPSPPGAAPAKRTPPPAAPAKPLPNLMPRN